MLKKLRHKKTAKKIWIFLALIIVPAFVLWGSGSMVKNQETSGNVGRINGKNIDIKEYKEALDAVRNQMVLQYGEDLSEIEKAINLQSMAWERLLLLSEAKKRRIKADDGEVIGLIQSYPFFQKKGKFDEKIYNQMMQYVFHTQPRVFEEEARQNLMLQKLFKDVTSKVNATEAEVREAYRKNNEQVSLYYIAGIYSDFAKDINPFEGELRDYFSKNALKFKQPLSFNLEYVTLSAEGQDEEGIKSRLKKIVSRLNKNTSLDKAAAESGLSAKETGFFGQTDAVPGIGWSPQILELASKAKAGDLLPFIYTDKNYYLIRLKDKKDPSIPPYETVKEKVREEFVKEQSVDLAKQKIENCLKKIKEELTLRPKKFNFEKAAKEFGLKTGTTAPVSYGSYIEGIGSSDTFWNIAQNLKEGGETSDVIYMPSGFYIIRLKSRVPMQENKFAAEKEEFAKGLLAQKKSETFYNFVLELKKRSQLF